VLDAVLEGNSVVVTILAIFTAIVLGGLLIAFTNTTVLHAWGNLFSNPGNAIAQAWDAASGAYVAIFEGAIFNPHTVSALFQQKSMSVALHDGALSAVFNPLSETCVQATPLILAGCRSRSRSGPACSTSARRASSSAGPSSPPGSATG